MILDMQPKIHAAKENHKKGVFYIFPPVPFLSYSYVKSHLNNDSCLPIYKTIPAICDTPHQTQSVQKYISLHFIMVIMVLWAKLWFVVVCQALFLYKRVKDQEGWHWNHTPSVEPRHPAINSTCFLKIQHLVFLNCVFYGTTQVKNYSEFLGESIKVYLAIHKIVLLCPIKITAFAVFFFVLMPLLTIGTFSLLFFCMLAE